MNKKVSQWIKKEKKRYTLARCLQGCLQEISVEAFQKMIWGYFEESPEATTLVIAHPKNGDLLPERVLYYIYVDASADEKWGHVGFCGILRRQLELLNYADVLGMVPVVRWGSKMLYYDSEMDNETRNAFEYFYEPVSLISWENIGNYCNVVTARVNHGDYFTKYKGGKRSYRIDNEEFEFLARIYKKYMHLNHKTANYIQGEIKKVIGKEKKTLGVHIRGSDFAKGFANHPRMVGTEEYIEKVKMYLDQGKYDQVFVATDDESALEVFEKEFGKSLVFYGDVIRSKTIEPVFALEKSMPLQYYKLGLEVLRDIYTLASCDGLIIGLSGVSAAAQYVAKAYNKSFEEVIVFDEGIYETPSKRAKHSRIMKAE